MVAVVVATLLACAAPSAPSATPRVFVAGIAVGAAADPQVVALLEDKVLVEARRHARRFEVLGKQEVQGVLDVEAARQALGCDTTSCASELADALGAPQLVTGQIGRVGSRWLLTLTRTDRTTMKVLARTQAEAASPEALLGAIPDQVDALFGVTTEPLWPVVGAGAATAGVGVVVGAIGGVALAFAWAEHGALATRGIVDDEFQQRRGTGELAAALGVGGLVAGGVAVAGGLATLAVGLALEQEVEAPP